MQGMRAITHLPDDKVGVDEAQNAGRAPQEENLGPKIGLIGTNKVRSDHASGCQQKPSSGLFCAQPGTYAMIQFHNQLDWDISLCLPAEHDKNHLQQWKDRHLEIG